MVTNGSPVGHPLESETGKKWASPTAARPFLGPQLPPKTHQTKWQRVGQECERFPFVDQFLHCDRLQRHIPSSKSGKIQNGHSAVFLPSSASDLRVPDQTRAPFLPQDTMSSIAASPSKRRRCRNTDLIISILFVSARFSVANFRRWPNLVMDCHQPSGLLAILSEWT